MKRFIYGLATLFFMISAQGQNLKSIKKDIQNSIDGKKGKLTKISDAIWEAAETSLEEFISSKILKDYARENDFEVIENVADIPTAFIAKYEVALPFSLSILLFLIPVLAVIHSSLVSTIFSKSLLEIKSSGT